MKIFLVRHNIILSCILYHHNDVSVNKKVQFVPLATWHNLANRPDNCKREVKPSTIRI